MSKWLRMSFSGEYARFHVRELRRGKKMCYWKRWWKLKNSPDADYLVGYKGVVIAEPAECHAPYVPDIDWDEYGTPTLVSEKLPDVHPFEQAEVSWDNAMVLTTLSEIQSLGRGLRGKDLTVIKAARNTGKTQIHLDMTKTRIEDV